MLIQHQRAAGLTIAVSILLSLSIAQPVAAGIQLQTIDDTAALNPSGHNVLVTGPIKCTEGETVEIRVTVTMDSTDAVAKGSTHLRCTGEEQKWSIHAATHGPNSLQAGEAHADAWAQTRFRGTVTETHTWDKEITLVQ